MKKWLLNTGRVLAIIGFSLMLGGNEAVSIAGVPILTIGIIILLIRAWKEATKKEHVI